MHISLERIELPLNRLRLGFRFTYAFHAHEIRFETDASGDFARIFPETFVFDLERHDPAELYVQLQDLWTKPELLAPKASRRDSEHLLKRLLIAMPTYLYRLVEVTEQYWRGELAKGGSKKGEATDGRGAQSAAILAGISRDIAVVAMTVMRFLKEEGLEDDESLRLTGFHFRKLHYRVLQLLVELRVSPTGLRAYLRGSLEPFDVGADAREIVFLMTLSEGGTRKVDSCLLSMAEQAFHDWLEEVCLDESNQAFEVEHSPFGDREREIFDVLLLRPATALVRGRDLVPFLRRTYDRDCLRVLRKLEIRFFRRYDVPHAAAMVRQGAWMAQGEESSDRRLSFHTTRNFALGIALMVLPFLAASIGYDKAPRFFDWLCAIEVGAVHVVVYWFLLYRFWWRRDLTFFHASVPRVSAGIIVGYLPVFLIDEVWAMARANWFSISAMIALMGLMTLLYIYAEAQRRLEDPDLAFSRARNIFLLGIFQALGVGIVITSLLGPFMVLRGWGDGVEGLTFAQVRMEVAPVFGELPRIIGVEPFYAFPSALIMMSFLSFFVGVFLQLLWEDLPLTEPM